jgi:hypothetical protein
MKKNYVPTTLDAFLNESKSIMLKRGYGTNTPVVVGTNAPLRDKILSFVSESNGKVTGVQLKKFIAGLNETSRNPVAAANMWLKRNNKFFITENKGGITYVKLSSIGQRLASRLINSNQLSENKQIRKKIDEEFDYDRLRNLADDRGSREDYIKNDRFRGDFNDDLNLDDDLINYDENEEDMNYDFVDRGRPGIYDMDENVKEDENEEKEEEKIDEAKKERIKKIIENIKEKRNKQLNEEEEKSEKPEESENDELTFDDLDLGDDDDKSENEDKDDSKLDDESENKLDDESTDDTEELLDNEETEDKNEEEKVEITEFVITVDNVEEAIQELSDLGVEAEQVTDEEGEAIEDQIKVSADDWETLKGWLEDKGVDIQEMFGGEIEVEDEEGLEDENGEELEDSEEFSLDLEGGSDSVNDLEDENSEKDGELSDDLNLDDESLNDESNKEEDLK